MPASCKSRSRVIRNYSQCGDPGRLVLHSGMPLPTLPGTTAAASLTAPRAINPRSSWVTQFARSTLRPGGLRPHVAMAANTHLRFILASLPNRLAPARIS